MLPAPDPGALRAFLEHPSRPAGTLTYHELQGFLFTVVSASESIPASEWIPIIFAGEDVDYASVDEANEVLGQIMALYNTANAAVLDPPTLLPADCPLRDDVLANFDDDAPIAQWSRGFLRGHQWLEELWEETLPEEFQPAPSSVKAGVQREVRGWITATALPLSTAPRVRPYVYIGDAGGQMWKWDISDVGEDTSGDPEIDNWEAGVFFRSYTSSRWSSSTFA